MQIVIDIPAYIGGLCVENNINDSVDIAILIDAVKNGIPLPEHHGRLIDANRLMRVDHIILESQVDNARTIIETTEEDD